MDDDATLRLEAVRSKWGASRKLQARMVERPDIVPKPVVPSTAEHAPVEASSEEYDGVPLSLVLERHLQRLKSQRSA